MNKKLLKGFIAVFVLVVIYLVSIFFPAKLNTRLDIDLSKYSNLEMTITRADFEKMSTGSKDTTLKYTTEDKELICSLFNEICSKRGIKKFGTYHTLTYGAKQYYIISISGGLDGEDEWICIIGYLDNRYVDISKIGKYRFYPNDINLEFIENMLSKMKVKSDDKN